jgi:hypothetical protein
MPWAVALAVLVVLPLPSRATLGQDEVSIETDRAGLRARRALRTETGYTVHELELPSGTFVREFISAAGKVFAVAWQGPALPDLGQILGKDNFQAFLGSPNARQVRRRMRVLQQPGLVVRSQGRPRAFSGQAYIPELVPPGVTVEGLR